MKQYKKVLKVTSDGTDQFFNLSYEIEDCVRKSNISEGLCVVFSQHTTSAVFLEYDEEALHKDWDKMLRAVYGEDTEYKIDSKSAGIPHLKQMILGASVTVPISDGRLDLGSHQYIMYGDFDVNREKSIVIKIIGE